MHRTHSSNDMVNYELWLPHKILNKKLKTIVLGQSRSSGSQTWPSSYILRYTAKVERKVACTEMGKIIRDTRTCRIQARRRTNSLNKQTRRTNVRTNLSNNKLIKWVCGVWVGPAPKPRMGVGLD